jgi:tetratricopeptide (TPR) repeat protein
VVNWADALYGKLPLLFSLGLAAVTSFFALMFWRLIRRQDAQFLGSALRLDGGPLTSRGRMMTVVCGVWLLFVGHCGVHQYLMFQAQRAVEKTSVGGAAWAQDHAVLSNLPARTSEAIDDGRRYLEWAQSWGVIDDVRARRNLAWLALLSENLSEAETQLTAATQLEPDHANSFHDLHRVRLLRDDVPGACDALLQVIALTPDEERPRLQLALLYGGTRNFNAAEATLRDAVRVLPDSIELNRLLGMLLMDMGRPDEARPFLESIPK